MISPRRIGVQPSELALPLRVEVLLTLSRLITECPEFQAAVSPFLLSPAFSAGGGRRPAAGGDARAVIRAAASRACAGRRRCRQDA